MIDAQGWEKPTRVTVTDQIEPGQNVIAIRGKNISDAAGVIAMLELNLGKGRKQLVITDGNWVSSAEESAGWSTSGFNDKGWTKVSSLGKLGVQPWGDVLALPQATPAEQLTVLPGFKAELVRSAEPGEGSWVCMTIDQKGRLIVSPQEGINNLLRITLSRQGRIEKVEKIDQPVGSAMGLLYAFDSLYVNGRGPDGLGIYRLHYNPDSDQYDAVKLIKKLEDSAGEHGSHAIVLGPDQHLYIVSGNFTKVPKDISPNSPHKHYAEDQLLPRANDGNGFGNGIKPPGGFLLRMDPEGKVVGEIRCASQACATLTILRSTPMGRCWLSTATWNGTGACRGTGPFGLFTWFQAVITDFARAAANGPSIIPTVSPARWMWASAHRRG